MQNAEAALDGNYDAFRAASTLADVADAAGARSPAEAAAAEVEAREARDRAAGRGRRRGRVGRRDRRREGRPDRRARPPPGHQRRPRRAAPDRPGAGGRRGGRRGGAAEQRAQERPSGARLRPRRPSRPPRSGRAGGPTPKAPQPQHADPSPSRNRSPSRSRSPSRTPTPAGTPGPARAVLGGAPAAIGFARAQLGEPYQWGAAGPGAWDCSGLTMGAWRAGGKYLPHYSVAQYEQSTPISAGPLQARRPGLLGLVERSVVDLPRRALRRRRPDHPRAAHRPAGRPRSPCTTGSPELLRPSLTLRRGGPPVEVGVAASRGLQVHLEGLCAIPFGSVLPWPPTRADPPRGPTRPRPGVRPADGRRRRPDRAARRQVRRGPRPGAHQPGRVRLRPRGGRDDVDATSSASGSATSSSRWRRPARPAWASPRSTAAAVTSAPRSRRSRRWRSATCRCW